MERLRGGACIAAQRVDGADTLYRGGQWVAYNTWTFVDQGNLYYRVRILTTYKTVKNRQRTDTLEVGVPCLI
jgi:hypothetical protein